MNSDDIDPGGHLVSGIVHTVPPDGVPTKFECTGQECADFLPEAVVDFDGHPFFLGERK